MREQSQPRAKKSLGQNFLRDKNIAEKIVRALEIRPEDAVLEIGPGPGALTAFLQKAGPRRLVLVEKDYHWAGERFAVGLGSPGFSVLLADALTLDWPRFSAPWKIIGNLPYNVASPLMWDIFSQAPGLARAVFMIQKEVGQRILAGPGSGQYGALSVWVRSHVRPKLEFIVPPQVFHPRPKVDSAVLSFVPPASGRPDFDQQGLARILRICFQQRRKQLGVIFKNNGLDQAVLERLGINQALRPETLDCGQFQAIGDSVAISSGS